MDLNAERLDVVCSVGAACEIRQIELDLVPSIIQSHRHRTDERLHPRRRLVVARSETPLDILIVQYLNLKCEVLLQILDDHDEEGQLDAQGLLRISRALHEGGADVRTDNLQHQGLDVVVSDALDVAIAHLLIPDLQRFTADTVQDRQEATLECVLEHFAYGSDS